MIFFKFLNQSQQSFKWKISIKESKPSKGDQRAKWSKKVNSRLSILFLHKPDSLLQSYTFHSFHYHSCFCSFHKHLLSNYNGEKNEFISNLDIQS